MDLAITMTEPQPGPEEDMENISVESGHKDDRVHTGMIKYVLLFIYQDSLIFRCLWAGHNTSQEVQSYNFESFVKVCLSFFGPSESQPIQLDHPDEHSSHPANIQPETAKDTVPSTSDRMSSLTSLQIGAG